MPVLTVTAFRFFTGMASLLSPPLSPKCPPLPAHFSAFALLPPCPLSSQVYATLCEGALGQLFPEMNKELTSLIADYAAPFWGRGDRLDTLLLTDLCRFY